MSYMASSFVQFPDFDTEHTRFATKYSLHMYRELGVDEDPRVKGVPVLFIPGNAGSYKQVRSLASEAEYFRQMTDSHYINQSPEKLALDFFTVDFNEDFTAFHGQTLLDQAEYLNDAIAYILALYHNDEKSRRDPSLPDPSSVILVGHSMGGVVARTMLTMPNYQTNSVNTIITLSAPHARPPVTFDSQIVDTYQNVNDYWRKSHSKEWGMDNPLWHVTVISIAGGGLDTIVPSDYASISSLVPDTHGFTVFTSSIPSVWTGMDHLAITWCDEFRKVVIRALFDVLDVNRPSQTKPRGERMSAFKKWFLTGLEPIAEKHLQNLDPSTILTLEDPSNTLLQQGERLVLRGIGYNEKRIAHFLPIPPQPLEKSRSFTLLTSVDMMDLEANVEVLFCSVYPLQAGHSANLFTMNVDLSGDAGATRLGCKSTTSDFIRLPASTAHSMHPFDKNKPFSYLQYNLDVLFEHQFVVVVEKAHLPSEDFLVAEFTVPSDARLVSQVGVRGLLDSPLRWTLPSERPLLTEIKVPALESSLLSYKLSIASNRCGADETLFRPLVRQYISDIHESKFFVNVQDIEVNLHGVAPYMPPSTRTMDDVHGLSFQLWTDPTCKQPLQISLALDITGSIGKLWMRYRTFFATFPLFIVALVLARQFKVYDESSIFMSFGEAMNQCLRRELPALIVGLVLPAVYMSNKASIMAKTQPTSWFEHHRGNATESLFDFTMNDLLLGSPDPFFWFLIPMFGIISIGLCIAINYFVLVVTYLLAVPVSYLKLSTKSEDPRRPSSSFTITSTRQRIITTSILLGLVATVLPYQFAYLVLCIVQIVTAIRALSVARESVSLTTIINISLADSYSILITCTTSTTILTLF
jgi:glycosylphosphatidylinositol deacylase